ncbi:hypothetical protein BOTBODRAFT_194158 [Botryobasidium botryosum FD-172 SS1]|uniref:Uncharacterized protein n=1 Tax=Botryobasidium botryosum (strain FD-172 SS1) TaxID=930990 RepID=A0A067MZI6_BOTB1|nr:hypothetical protein BOTBODRAFT_194158 [Botryobasidium botryosum FD-172 SS1]
MNSLKLDSSPQQPTSHFAGRAKAPTSPRPSFRAVSCSSSLKKHPSRLLLEFCHVYSVMRMVLRCSVCTKRAKARRNGRLTSSLDDMHLFGERQICHPDLAMSPNVFERISSSRTVGRLALQWICSIMLGFDRVARQSCSRNLISPYFLQTFTLSPSVG